MNILEQLNIAKARNIIEHKARNTLKVTTLRDLEIGESFEFAADDPLRIGEMVYICNPRNCAYGRAIITNNPHQALFIAKRTS